MCGGLLVWTLARPAAKARGLKLDNPNGAAALRRAGKGGEALRAVVCQNADELLQHWPRCLRSFAARAIARYAPLPTS